MYVFPGLGKFLDDATEAGADRAELTAHHGRALNRVGHFLAQAATAGSPEAAREQAGHARRLLRLYGRAQAIAEAMIAECEAGVGVEPPRPPKEPKKSGTKTEEAHQ